MDKLGPNGVVGASRVIRLGDMAGTKCCNGIGMSRHGGGQMASNWAKGECRWETAKGWLEVKGSERLPFWTGAFRSVCLLPELCV